MKTRSRVQSTSKQNAPPEDPVTINSWFSHPRQPVLVPFPVEIPRELYYKAVKYSRRLFQNELRRDHKFHPRLQSIKFWRPQTHFSDEAKKEIWSEHLVDAPDTKSLPILLTYSFEEKLNGVEDKHLIHLIVTAEIEDEAGDNKTNKRYREEASETLTHLRAKKRRTELPPLHGISAILTRPLNETEKIPISHQAYADLITPLHEITDTCREEDISILFRKSDGDALSPLNDLYTTVVRTPPATGTEEYFRGFWDRNIKDVGKVTLPLHNTRIRGLRVAANNVVELVFDGGASIRSSNRHTETKNLRPDFGLLVKNVCVFRGKEKGPESAENPRTELVDKLTWVYKPAEYLLGYYCCGLNLTLAAICPPLTPGGKPVLHDLVSTNLRLRRDRIANIRQLINMSTLLNPLSDIVQSARGEFQPMVRNLATIEITSSCIVKTYTCEYAYTQVKHLNSIYKSLQYHSVPNTDHIMYTKGKTVYLAPRGISLPPKIQVDLRECIICIPDALVVLHKIPIFHRDIRWPNIIQNANNPHNWILIDWEDAGIPPTSGQPRFNLSDHSRRILEDNHGAEVDIWGVGYLIISCDAADLSSEFKDLGSHICEKAEELTAEKVLELVRSIP